MTFFIIQSFFTTIFTQAQDLHLSLVVTKGHVISKGLFGVIVSTEKPTKKFKDFCPSL
jgi:hypothetical protein